MLLHFDCVCLTFLLIFLFPRGEIIYAFRDALSFTCISTFWKYVISSLSGKSLQGGKENMKTIGNLVVLVIF